MGAFVVGAEQHHPADADDRISPLKKIFVEPGVCLFGCHRPPVLVRAAGGKERAALQPVTNRSIDLFAVVAFVWR